MKSAQMLVLVRYGHALKVLVISDGLEVPTDKQAVNLIVVSRLELLDVPVYRIQLSVTASLNSNLERPQHLVIRLARALKRTVYLHF